MEVDIEIDYTPTEDDSHQHNSTRKTGGGVAAPVRPSAPHAPRKRKTRTFDEEHPFNCEKDPACLKEMGYHGTQDPKKCCPNCKFVKLVKSILKKHNYVHNTSGRCTLAHNFIVGQYGVCNRFEPRVRPEASAPQSWEEMFGL